ncbi:DUF6907 domain-containing protein [Streptomyces sp. NPDC101152]|uniref:DUF6907 domain-containing protein n=1 Tax=Streptomyces sp. NPDC101152 TaxID=3366116 RepID=UPI0038079072
MSDEQDRARTFVERHFPQAAAFLAAERGEGPAPVYGPTEPQNDHDDQPEPWVTVRVGYRVSRFELLAALAAGYATANEMQDPDTMTVAEIRYDVEAFFADTSARDLDAMVEEVASKVERGEDHAQFEALRRAMDRAYPVSGPPPAAVQRPVYDDGTVTLDTLDHGRITIDEPIWCTGHDGEQIVHRADVTHVGVTVTGEYAGVEFLPARISWAPFAELRPEPLPLADVDEFPSMTPDELRELGAELGLHVGRLYSKANELDRIRRAEA